MRLNVLDSIDRTYYAACSTEAEVKIIDVPPPQPYIIGEAAAVATLDPTGAAWNFLVYIQPLGSLIDDSINHTVTLNLHTAGSNNPDPTLLGFVSPMWMAPNVDLKSPLSLD